MNPLVSIITAAYNSEKHIGDSINSVLNQSYINWELHIIDDYSTDRTKEIVKEFQRHDNRIILYSLKSNSGSGKARNLGINKSRGTYITFLDSDDFWDPNKLRDHIEFMEKNKIFFSHASYGYSNEKGEILDKQFLVSTNPITYTDLLKKTEISCLTAIINQDVIGKYYMSEDRRKQDYFLWLNILKDGHKSFGFNKIQSYYRLHENQVPKNYKLVIDHFYFLKNRLNLNLFSSAYYTIHYVFNALKKYIL